MQYQASITNRKNVGVNVRLFDPATGMWWAGAAWNGVEAAALLSPLTRLILADPLEDRYVGLVELPDGGPWTVEYLDADSGQVIGEEPADGDRLYPSADTSPLADLVAGKVKDDSNKLVPADYANALGEALNRYSKARPLEAVADITGDGGRDYALPSGWLEGFSGIAAIEYPAGLAPESLVDRRDWKLYATPAGKKLRLLADTPAEGETLRVTYTAVHTEQSVPAVDLEAAANLAASLCLRQLAAAYGNTGDSLIQADSVNYRSKTDEYRRLADSFEKLYKDHLGLKDSDTTPAAMATAPAPESTRVRLTHRRS